MGLKTGASVLIVQQINYDFTNASCSFLPARYKDDCNPAQAGFHVIPVCKKASQAKALLSLYWMMAWSGTTQTSMPTM